jgi:hypothetical protein
MNRWILRGAATVGLAAGAWFVCSGPAQADDSPSNQRLASARAQVNVRSHASARVRPVTAKDTSRTSARAAPRTSARATSRTSARTGASALTGWRAVNRDRHAGGTGPSRGAAALSIRGRTAQDSRVASPAQRPRANATSRADRGRATVHSRAITNANARHAGARLLPTAASADACVRLGSPAGCTDSGGSGGRAGDNTEPPLADAITQADTAVDAGPAAANADACLTATIAGTTTGCNPNPATGTGGGSGTGTGSGGSGGTGDGSIDPGTTAGAGGGSTAGTGSGTIDGTGAGAAATGGGVGTLPTSSGVAGAFLLAGAVTATLNTTLRTTGAGLLGDETPLPQTGLDALRLLVLALLIIAGGLLLLLAARRRTRTPN